MGPRLLPSCSALVPLVEDDSLPCPHYFLGQEGREAEALPFRGTIQNCPPQSSLFPSVWIESHDFI